MFKKELKTIVILSLFVLLAACSSDVKEHRLDSSEEFRTFNVGQVMVDTIGVSGMNNIEVLKNGKVLNFSACIQDRAVGSAMTLRAFTITGGRDLQTVRTDENGCLYWSEAISIEDYVSMGFQFFTRTISGQNPYYGSVTIEFAFQPLENGSDAVVDLRHAGIPTSDSSKSLRGNTPRFMIGKIQMIPAISAQTEEELKSPYRAVAVQVKVKLLHEQTGKGITKHKFKIVLSDTPDVSNWDAVETREYADNTSGEFVTSANIKYKRFAGEYYMEKYIVVKSMESPFDETPIYRKVYIDPWQWWEKFFFWDTKYDAKGDIPVESTKPPERPQLLIQEVWLSYTGNVEDSYRLDKHLNFSFTKNYQIKFRPFLDRKKTYVPRGMIFEKITIAELKARLTLIRPKNGEVDLLELEKRGMEGLEDYEYVTGTEVIIPVERALARANFDLPFDFTDIPFMVTRSLLLVEIAPADADWEVDPALVTITMKAGEFWVTEGALFATKINPDGYIPEELLERINRGEKISSEKKHEMPSEFLPRDKWNNDLIDPLSSYIDHHMRYNPRMKVLDEDDAEDYPFFEDLRTDRTLFRDLYNYASGAFTPGSYNKMNYYYGDDKQRKRAYFDFMGKACDLFYPIDETPVYSMPGTFVLDPSAYVNGDCRSDKEPLNQFVITPVTFLTGDPLFRSYDEETGDEINHVVKLSTGRDKFGINLNLKKGYASGSAEGASNSFGIKLSSLLNLVPPLGATAQKVGLDFGYSYSDSRVSSDTKVRDVGVASNYTLISDHLQLGFKAPTRSCLLIEKRGDRINPFDDESTQMTYMVCSSEENSMQYFTEDWYFVNPANTDLSHFVDYNGIQNRNMIYPIRGIHNFVGLRDMISTHLDYFLHTNKEMEQPLVRLALEDLFNISPRGIPAFTDGHYPGLIIGNVLEAETASRVSRPQDRSQHNLQR